MARSTTRVCAVALVAAAVLLECGAGLRLGTHVARGLRQGPQRPGWALHAKKTKKKGGSATKKKKAAIGGGFGAVKVEATPEEKAVAAAVKKVKADPTDEKRWLALASELGQQEEYADARQVLEAGLTKAADGDLLSSALGAMRRIPPSEEIEAAKADVAWPGQDDTEIWHFDAAKQAEVGFDRYSVPEAPRPCNRGTVHASGEDLIFASRSAVIPPEECDWVIEQMDKAAEKAWMQDKDPNNIGADAIYSRPFPDRLWMRDMPGVKAWFDHRLKTRLFPMLQSLYPHIIPKPNDLRCHDAFISRYDASRTASLEMHRDTTSFSFTIAMNRATDYEGGGTSLPMVRKNEDADFAPGAVKTDIGGVVSFPGQCWHGGNKVESGARYIIPLFIFLDYNKSGKDRGYVIDQLRDAGAIGDDFEMVF